jgi:hypothetical protein
MSLLIRIDDPVPRRWHTRLGDALSTRHGPCAIARDDWAPSQSPSTARPAALAGLLLLDQTLHGARESGLNPVACPGPSPAGPISTVIDLTSAAGPHTVARPGAIRHLIPLYDGAAGELALWAAILDGRAPRLQLRDAVTGQILDLGLPALDAPHRLRASADVVLVRLVEGIVRTLANADRTFSGASLNPTDTARVTVGNAARCLSRIVAGKAQRALQHRLGTAPQWSVAWRAAPAPPALPSGDLDVTGWTLLNDDGQRYYADPFAFTHDGKRVVFVEEYPCATGRGLISAVEIGADHLPRGIPRPVLETPFHLSYPQVFADAGVIYMLPEAAASGRLTLYRAERFPDRWVAVADLIEAPLHDATLVRHDGLYCIFATEDGGGATSWDALHLYSAPALTGPFTAHPMNPVLVDAAAARPAGAVVCRDGALWRPAQNCRNGYGAALTLARIDRLDRDGYAQGEAGTAMRCWRAPAASGLMGPHTWNTGAGLELIDLYGPAGKIRRALGRRGPIG